MKRPSSARVAYGDRGGDVSLSASESTALEYEQRDPDVRLMLRVRDDDAAAFEQLVLRHQTRLITILEHLVGSRHQAEDLAQDVFLRVYRARKRYLPEAKFSTWLYTIANNVARNSHRTLARRPEVHLTSRDSRGLAQNPLEQLVAAASGQLPTRQLDKFETVEIVQLAVQSLNERQRMAVLLAKFEGMSYAEIANIMDLSPQAIKSLLSRARNKLREILEPYLQHGEMPTDGSE